MAMTLVKKTADYSIYKRGDNRFAVRDANKQAVNGEEKVKILLAEELIKATVPAEPAAEAPAEEAAAAADAPEAEAETESAGDDAPAEEEAGEED